MKLQLKGLIAGIIVGATIASGVTVAATNTTTLYNVLAEGIRIVIDGKEFTPTDSTGAVVQPMIYNGTTYLPVRAVANAFDKAVYWDGEETTVYLGDMDGKLKKPTARFADIENISTDRDGFEIKNNVFDNYGGFYNLAINNDDFWTNDTGAIFEGLLDKKFSTFKATLFVPKGAAWETCPYITIIGDEKILYTSNEMSKTAEPVEISVDISEVNDFKIIFSEYNKICIANEGFYQ